MVLEKTLDSPLYCRENKPVNQRNSVLNIHWKDWCWSWTPILSPPDVNSWPTGKDPDAGKDWRQKEKWMTEDEMFGWHHWLNGNEFEQALVISNGQGSLACCSLWSWKESDMTEWLNWTHNLILKMKRLKKNWSKSEDNGNYLET